MPSSLSSVSYAFSSSSFPSVQQVCDRALDALKDLARPDGTYEGNLEAGLLFNATNIVVRRFRRAQLSRAEEEQELSLSQYILANQDVRGWFRAYPDGPPSAEATRLATLALRRVLDSNSLLQGSRRGSLRTTFWVALDRAARAPLNYPEVKTEELVFQSAFRRLMELLDANRAGAVRGLGDPRAFALSTWGVAWLMKGPAWNALEACCYPFITSVLPMLTLMAEGVRSRGMVGKALRKLGGLRAAAPIEARRQEALASLVTYLLTHQDGTGAFFYSCQYTELFIAALEGALEAGIDSSHHAAIQQAIGSATAYLETNQPSLAGGRCVRFLGSDVWDTAGVGIAVLNDVGQTAWDPPHLSKLAQYLLKHQNDDGGWPFGRQSRFTDTDSTAWALTLLMRVRIWGRLPHLNSRLDAAAVRALDFLDHVICPNGGYAVWGKSPLPKPRGTVGELASVVLDLPTEDVTGRVMMALGPLRRLCAEDASFAQWFGTQRQHRLTRLCDASFDFLKERRDPELGLWPSRWTCAFLPGTAFVLEGLRQHPYPERQRFADHAARTVASCQNLDGGFGESPQSDRLNRFLPSMPSTLIHTVAALNILHEAGIGRESPLYRRATDFVLSSQKPDGSFPEHSVYTCFTGFYYRYPLMTQSAAVAFLLREMRLRMVAGSDR